MTARASGTTGPASGARWITAAFVLVGALNYGYAVVLTHALAVAAYAIFAAGQSLLLTASTVAAACVPWVLAQAVARAQTEEDKATAVRFAAITCVASGALATLAVSAVASQFAGRLTTAVLAGSTMLIFLGTTTTGWLQGQQRMPLLALLTVGDVVLKLGAGFCLVLALRLGDAGALAGFGVGAVLLLLWWPRYPLLRDGFWRRAVRATDLWRRVVGITAVQLSVALLSAIDLLLVTVLPVARVDAASYQASAVVSRVPVFIASALSIAFFPALARRSTTRGIADGALLLFLQLTLPLLAVLATTPAAVLGFAFPPAYHAMRTLVAFTAVEGFAIGGINMITTFFQARAHWSCITWQLLGLACYVAGLLAGWRVGGIVGLAAGGVGGTLISLGLLAVHFVRRQGWPALTPGLLVEPLVVLGALVAVRHWPVAWCVLAAAVGIRVAVRFFHAQSRHRPAHRAAPPPVHRRFGWR